MTYTFWNFKDWFFEHNIDFTYHIKDDAATIDRLCLTTALRDPLAKLSAGISDGALLKSPEYQSCMYQNENWMKFPISTPCEIMNLGNEMLAYYSEWENQILDCIIQNAPLTVLLDSAAKFLNIYISFFSETDGRTISSSNLSTELDLDTVNVLTANIAFGHPHPVFRKPTPFSSVNYLILPLDSTVERIGYFIIAGKRAISPGTLHLVKQFSLMSLNYFQESADNQSSDLLLENFFRFAISEYHLNQKKLSSLLEAAHWPANGYFTIFNIQANGNVPYTQQNELLQTLKQAFPYVCCFRQEQSILCITYSPFDTIVFIIEKIQKLAPAKSYTIGQSLPTNEPWFIGNYYTQSQKALEYAISHELHFVSAEEILPQLIEMSFRSNAWLQSLIHPDLYVLAECDKETQNELLHTLYTYLILGKNNTLTAQALFIHRNTLRYRMTKIKELIQTDLTNEKETAQLLASSLIFPKS